MNFFVAVVTKPFAVATWLSFSYPIDLVTRWLALLARIVRALLSPALLLARAVRRALQLLANVDDKQSDGGGDAKTKKKGEAGEDDDVAAARGGGGTLFFEGWKPFEGKYLDAQPRGMQRVGCSVALRWSSVYGPAMSMTPWLYVSPRASSSPPPN